MRSAPTPGAASPTAPSTDDRSTQARIRDAALVCFAEQGFSATTVRAIAARAGVSAPLVIHHFGSKARLRAACDAFVSAYVRQRKLEAMRAGPGLDPLSLLRSEDDRLPLLAYLARALHDDPLALHEHVERVLGVDLSVEAGEVCGFIGPNGAGESTTIRVLMDLLRPTAGDVRVFGSAPLAERFGLDRERPLRLLSKGHRQKVGVIQAFMHEPALLILDGPSSGLDPLLQHEFLDLVRETAGRGATVCMASHVLREVESVADRVAIVRTGRIVDVDSVRGLRTPAGQRVRLRFAEAPELEPFAAPRAPGRQPSRR